MTDTVTHPSEMRVRANGIAAGTFYLPNDPADHRGALSWHAQPHDKKLSEAGSYGYLTQATIPAEPWRRRPRGRKSSCASKWTTLCLAVWLSTANDSDAIPSTRPWYLNSWELGTPVGRDATRRLSGVPLDPAEGTCISRLPELQPYRRAAAPSSGTGRLWVHRKSSLFDSSHTGFPAV